MIGSPGEFTWAVPKSGFRIETAKFADPAQRFTRGGLSVTDSYGTVENGLNYFDDPAPFLVFEPDEFDERDFSYLPSRHDVYQAREALKFVMSGSNAREYQPLTENRALFRELSSPIPTASNILTYANQWGALGSEGTGTVNLVANDGSTSYSGKTIWGEALENWKVELEKIHIAVSIWDAVVDEKHHLLERAVFETACGIQWDPSAVREWGNSRGGDVSTANFHPERARVLEDHGTATAAMLVVEDLLNEGLCARVHEQCKLDQATSKMAITFVPINLIGALWLQLANAVRGNYDYVQCKSCEKWFEIAIGSGRPDKQYCSDACKMRAYRTRKAQNQSHNSTVFR